MYEEVKGHNACNIFLNGSEKNKSKYLERENNKANAVK